MADWQPPATDQVVASWQPPASDKIISSPSQPAAPGVLSRFAHGLADPAIGAAQLLSHNPLDLIFGKPAAVAAAPTLDKTLDAYAAKRAADYDALRKATGQTGIDWARLAGNIANPLNYVLPGMGAPASLAGRLGLAALSGAGSAALQPVESGSFAKGKAEQALAGGIAGPVAEEAGRVAVPAIRSLGEKALSLVSPTQKAANAARKTLGTENRARQMISRQFTKGVNGGAPSAQDVIDEMTKAAAEKQPLTLADANNTELGALAGTTYRQGGSARSRMKSFFEGRNREAMSRTQGLIDRYLSDSSLKTTADNLIASRTAHADPIWTEVRRGAGVAPLARQVGMTPERLGQAQADGTATTPGAIWSPRLQELLDQPEVKSGIRRGYHMERRAAVGAGKPFKPHEYAVIGTDKNGDPIVGAVPNMSLLMVAKEGLDAIIGSSAMRDPLTGRLTKNGRSYSILRDGLISELDRLNPLYREARNQWSGDTASIRALDDGRHFMENKRFSLEELPAHIAKMTDSDKQFFVIGVADALKNRLFGAADSANKGRIINTEAARRRLRPLFGSDEEAQMFLDSIERERQMGQTGSRIYGGSPTGERVADDKTAQALVHAANGLVSMFHGRFVSSMMSAMRLRQLFGGKPDPKLSEEIARYLTTPGLGLSAGDQILPQIVTADQVGRQRLVDAVSRGLAGASGTMIAPR